MAYYNEIDAYAAQWLRNLIAAGHIAPGHVDERSIVDVEPDDLRGFTQCHFFAGIGVWSHALRCAGWPDDRPVWTGSCPCQPFSAAGKGDEFGDERHLWPAWFSLIRERRPVAVFGEQVASKDALAWLDHVCADLEGEGYAVGAVDSCAAGYGAPHIRQRLYFVADANGRHASAEREQRSREQRLLAASGGLGPVADTGCSERRAGNAGWNDDDRQNTDGQESSSRATQRSEPCELADPIINRQSARSGNERCAESAGSEHGDDAERCGELGNASSAGLPARESQDLRGERRREERRAALQPSATNGFWRDAEWIACRDGKARPTEPKFIKMVDGSTGALGLVRSDEQNQESEEVNASQDNGNGGSEVRTVQQDGTIARPSHGSQSRQQHPIELADFVRLLPSSLALAELHGDAATAEALRALFSPDFATRLVQHAPDSQETLWRSIDEETQDRIRVGFKSGQFVKTIEHPLVTGAPARVGRLRAYGNAICAPQAQEFVAAFMSVAP